jgi:hypothetical protein
VPATVVNKERHRRNRLDRQDPLNVALRFGHRESDRKPVKKPLRYFDIKKQHHDLGPVIRSKASATLLRLRALRQPKGFFDNLPGSLRLNINWLEEKLVWIRDNPDNINLFQPQYAQGVVHGLNFCGNISNTSLRLNYRRIAEDWAEVRSLGYFNICRSPESFK